MIGYIDGVNFKELEPMKYFAPPSSWSNEKAQDNARSKIFSGEWFGSQKFDGYFAKLVKDEDGIVGLYSRSRNVQGEFPEKHEWVPHLQPFFDSIPNGSCLLGEIYLPSAPGSKNITALMGCLKDKAIARQEKGEKLHFYVFDCLAWEGKSNLTMSFKDRVDELNLMWRAGYENEYVSIAKYFTGKELWAMLQDTLGRGGEGMVITHQDGKYEPGKRPSKTTLKIKKELKHTIDCFFTGVTKAPTKEYTGKELDTWQYWENSRTGEKICGEKFNDYYAGAPIIPVTKSYFYDFAGSLQIAVLAYKEGNRCKIKDVVYENTEIYPLGWLSGLSEEIKANPEKYAFRPLEVTAMEFDKISNTLRHGKAVGWRDDLTIKDCTLSKIVGK